MIPNSYISVGIYRCGRLEPRVLDVSRCALQPRHDQGGNHEARRRHGDTGGDDLDMRYIGT
jgi:hypothetical protein